MATDVTDVRAFERQQKLLIGELDHRVKNTLAIVKSLVSQTLRDAALASEVVDLVTERLQALSAVHDVLNRERWDGANVTDVAEAVVKPYAGAKRITISGPTARLESNGAVTLALALHELAVNAVKHGALSTPTGQVQLRWIQADDSIVAEWRESGGPRVKPPERSGFGSRLLRQGLRADLDFAPDGLICRFRVPAQSDDGPLASNQAWAVEARG